MAGEYGQKFAEGDVLLCPVCRGKLVLKKTRLACKERHSFDVAGQGYVNLLAGRQDRGKYSKGLFAARRAVYKAGLYAQFEQALIEMAAPWLAGDGPRILDCGCGEGWFLHRLGQSPLMPQKAQLYGVDIQKDAIAMAAGLDRRCKWLVGDLQAMPLRRNRFDLILDILTPASYAEFARLLRKGGAVLKVFPGEHYLQELRCALGMGAYSGDAVREYARKMFRVLGQRRVSYTATGLSEEIKRQVGQMSPLGFHSPQAAKDGLAFDGLTIDLHIVALGPK